MTRFTDEALVKDGKHPDGVHLLGNFLELIEARALSAIQVWCRNVSFDVTTGARWFYRDGDLTLELPGQFIAMVQTAYMRGVIWPLLCINGNENLTQPVGWSKLPAKDSEEWFRDLRGLWTFAEDNAEKIQPSSRLCVYDGYLNNPLHLLRARLVGGKIVLVVDDLHQSIISAYTKALANALAGRI